MAAAGHEDLLALVNVIIMGKVLCKEELVSYRPYIHGAVLLTLDFVVGVLLALAHVDEVKFSAGVGQLLSEQDHTLRRCDDFRSKECFG